MTTISLALLVWRKPLYVCAPRCLHAWSSTAAISQRPEKLEQVRVRPFRVNITARATMADVKRRSTDEPLSSLYGFQFSHRP